MPVPTANLEVQMPPGRGFGGTFLTSPEARRRRQMADDWEVQRLLRKAIAAMPVTIESGALDPKTSATDRLKWVELAIKVFQGPGDRRTTDDDLENERK